MIVDSKGKTIYETERWVNGEDLYKKEFIDVDGLKVATPENMFKDKILMYVESGKQKAIPDIAFQSKGQISKAILDEKASKARGFSYYGNLGGGNDVSWMQALTDKSVKWTNGQPSATLFEEVVLNPMPDKFLVKNSPVKDWEIKEIKDAFKKAKEEDALIKAGKMEDYAGRYQPYFKEGTKLIDNEAEIFKKTPTDVLVNYWRENKYHALSSEQGFVPGFSPRMESETIGKPQTKVTRVGKEYTILSPQGTPVQLVFGKVVSSVKPFVPDVKFVEGKMSNPIDSKVSLNLLNKSFASTPSVYPKTFNVKRITAPIASTSLGLLGSIKAPEYKVGAFKVSASKSISVTPKSVSVSLSSVKPSVSASSSLSSSVSLSRSTSSSLSKSASTSSSISKGISISPSISKSISKSASLSKSISQSISKSISKSISTSTSISTNITKSPPKIRFPVSKKMQSSKVKPSVSLRQAFSVFSPRGKGKKRKLVELASGLPVGLAAKVGADYARSKLARTFILKPSGTTQMQDIQTPGLGDVFQAPSQKSSLRRYGGIAFVQKAKYSLSSFGEKFEIKQARSGKFR
jgi:hypothetical protein